MLVHKISLKNFKKDEIIQGMFLKHNKIKSESSNTKICGKYSNTWKVSNLFPSNSQSKNKSQGKLEI